MRRLISLIRRWRKNLLLHPVGLLLCKRTSTSEMFPNMKLLTKKRREPWDHATPSVTPGRNATHSEAQDKTNRENKTQPNTRGRPSNARQPQTYCVHVCFGNKSVWSSGAVSRRLPTVAAERVHILYSAQDACTLYVWCMHSLSKCTELPWKKTFLKVEVNADLSEAAPRGH